MKSALPLILLFLTGCGAGTCKGVYTQRDDSGVLKKYNEYETSNGCMTDTISLSRWEASLEARNKKGVSCVPQPQFASQSFVSDGNYYSYRDGKVYLTLDSITGEYTKLTLAEGKNGEQLFSRLLGCFYERNGQILLDTVNVASSQYFDPMEIFTYTSSGNSMDMVRFDDSSSWDYRFCPYLNTPWGFCDLLRNGNEMFWPTLTAAQQSSLLTEALMIRKQFNYTTVTSDVATIVYNSAVNSRTESVAENYKYAVQTIVDTPRYIDQAWADYVKGNRPSMPDTTSSTMPPVCYPARKSVTLSDGSTGIVMGQVCYENGTYTFTYNN